MKEINKNSQKTICFVTSTLQGGGAQRVLTTIANKFATDGWQTHLVCFVAQNVPSLFTVHPNIKLHYMPRCYTIKDKIVPECLKLLTALIDEISPDIVIPFLMPATAYSFYAAKKLNIKIIVSERNDPFCTPADSFWRNQRDHIFKNSDGCVFQTQHAFEYFKNENIKKFAIIRNPIDLSSAPEHLLKAHERSHRVVCVGKYEPQKNLNFLLDVFYEFSKHFPDYILEIYGNDYHRRRLLLNQKAIALGIDNKVQLNDARPDIFNVIYDARMCVLPSKYEGMPNALIESVSLGIPSIASDCPAYGGRQVVNSGENGFLLPVDDKEEFLNKIILLASDDELCDKFTVEGKKVQEKFNVDEVYRLWKNLVQEVLDC